MCKKTGFTWKGIYLSDKFDQIQRVDTIEEALEIKKDEGQYCGSLYVICEEIDNTLYGACSGRCIEEVLGNAEKELSSNWIKYLYPAAKSLVCAMEHECSVECKFNGKLAVQDNDFYIKNRIDDFKDFLRRLEFINPSITVYVPDATELDKIYYPILYVKNELDFEWWNSREELLNYEKELAIQTKIFIKVACNKQVLLFEFSLVSSYQQDPYDVVDTNYCDFSYIKSSLVRYNALDFINKLFFDPEFKEHFYISLSPVLLNSFSSDNFYFLHPTK